MGDFEAEHNYPPPPEDDDMAITDTESISSSAAGKRPAPEQQPADPSEGKRVRQTDIKTLIHETIGLDLGACADNAASLDGLTLIYSLEQEDLPACSKHIRCPGGHPVDE